MDYHMQAIGDNALVFPSLVQGNRDCCVEPRLVAPNITQRHAMLHASASQGCGRCPCLSCRRCRHRCAQDASGANSKCTVVVWPKTSRTRRPFASASAVAARFVGNALGSDSKALVAWGREREGLESCCRSLIHPWTACNRVQQRIDVFSLAGPPLDPPFYQDARITCRARDALSRVEYESYLVIGPKPCLHR